MNRIVFSYAEDCIFGFGDFLRGSICVRGVCKKQNIDFDIDFSKNKIGQYVESRYTGEDYSNRDIAKVKSLNEQKIKELLLNKPYLFLCSNASKRRFPETYDLSNGPKTYFNSVDEETKNFYQDNLKFSECIVSEAKKRLKQKNIGKFKVLQIRVGDEFSFSNGDGFKYKDETSPLPRKNGVDFAGYRHKLRTNSTPYALPLLIYFKFLVGFMQENNDEDFIFISDSSELKEMLNTYIEKEKIDNFHVLSFLSTHTSEAMLDIYIDQPKKDGLFDTVLEMYLVSLSEGVKCFTCYRFPSNFTKSICVIFGINHEVDIIKNHIS